jgi:hypothetical protein
MILRVILRLGAIPYGVRVQSHPYKRRLDNYSGYEHLTASMQPRKYSEDTFKVEFGRT